MSESLDIPAPLDFKSFSQTLEGQGVRTETLVVDQKGTMYTPYEEETECDVRVEHLPVIMGEGEHEFKVKGRLGAGGMGLIHLAEQSVLDRDVAVKQALKKARSNNAADLLAEGIVTGQLEHPNVVPMYALGRNASGDVLLVMKRIEGTAWSELLEEYPPTSEQHLERHLRILMDVSEAIAFAHTKGVVHRDLKPQNVMVGSFGEVYVLDWGLALGVSEHAPKGALRQASLKGISGTPAYMAPEMTMPSETIDHRTDVYLLGAVLFELLTGQPPHDRMDVMKGLHEAFLSRVNIPEHVPEEIRAVCLMALKRSPSERYQNVRQFIEAVDAFLHHAAARELIKEGEKRLEEFLRLDAEDARDTASENETQRAYIESQFALTQALRLWRDSQSAKKALRRGSEAMAWNHVRRDRPASAEIFIRHLTVPAPELVTAIEELKAKQAAKVNEIANIRAALFQESSEVGRASRAWLFFAIGSLWLVSQLVAGQLSRNGTFINTAENRTVGQIILVVVVGAILYWKRKTLFRNRLNSSIMWSLMVMLVCLTLFWVVAIKTSVTFAEGVALSHVVMVASTLVAATREKRFTVGGFMLTIGCLAVFWPDYALELNGLSVFLGILVLMGFLLREKKSRR